MQDVATERVVEQNPTFLSPSEPLLFTVMVMFCLVISRAVLLAATLISLAFQLYYRRRRAARPPLFRPIVWISAGYWSLPLSFLLLMLLANRLSERPRISAAVNVL